MTLLKYSLWLLLGSSLAPSVALGGNPMVTNIFTADPTGRVFGGRLYVYTSHDEPDATYWDMVDWQLLSTADLAPRPYSENLALAVIAHLLVGCLPGLTSANRRAENRAIDVALDCNAFHPVALVQEVAHWQQGVALSFVSAL